MTNPSDLTRVSRESADRLSSLGVHLDGRETPAELAEMQEAVERFEEAVQSRGGDLMMDEGVPGKAVEPDDRHFALPRRKSGEPVGRYLERLSTATDGVLHHRSLE
ncbi:MAG TPA: hypothetical protein VJU15_06340 [Gemmatimonadales bacterium]|nr:hypothetical protein [Gemmatimonadales bacterium]